MKAAALAAACLASVLAFGCGQQNMEGCGPAVPVAPAPPAKGLSCPGNPDHWVPSPTRKGPTRLAEVQSAAEAVHKANAALFDGDKLKGECHSSAPVFFAALSQELRSRGLCAWPAGDAIHPVSTEKGIAEEYHLITFGGCTLWPASRNNYKGDWIMKD